MDDALMQYIATERSRGVADGDIKKALLEKGWDAGKVGAAFGDNVVHATPATAQKGLFGGRVSRREYFFASLLMLGIGLMMFLFIAFMTGYVFGMPLMPMADVDMMGIDMRSAILSAIFLIAAGLACFIFSLSLMVRRLHDLGKEWFWVFLTFIPVVTFFFSLYLLFFKGEQRANAYGPVPNNSRKIFDVLLGR
ncbi:MAG TPA: DUF805 domain-containing protein [Candidatus Paceibacterota bacterium]|nr:DUF805 domain-containing protein [Candidatus Paceibacterota bacterium]